MRRHLIRPYGQSISATRALSLLMLLVLLWMMYGWLRNPAIWSWLARREDDEINADREGPAAVVQNSEAQPNAEIIVPGPNDQDRLAAQGLKPKLELMTDRAPLRAGEMPVYWQLMGWSRTEAFEKLKSRAVKGISFSQLWDEPNRYRGQLMHLKLHVRRVLRYESDENPLNVKTVYEAWGWTDDSKSFPYVIVFPERPPGLPIGTDVRIDMEFVGYYLKIMSYTAFDVPRGAPLLVGRVKLTSKPPESKASRATSAESLGIAAVGLIALCGFGAWHLFRPRKSARGTVLPNDLRLG
ncbi:MAG: hypothetical protein JWM11_5822 [Planctomycetaceae bacterium]|nr:hypothetical protein [Planctomycetaceae bacterium]